MSLMVQFAKFYDKNKILGDEFLASLSTQEIMFLGDFSLSAHDYQIPPHKREEPITDYSTWLLLGGRGSGKTCAGAYYVIDAIRSGAKHIALVGATVADVRNVMIEGVSGIMSLSPVYDKPHYYKSKNYLEWKNGARAYIFSGANPDKLRGPQFEVAWCDELCKWKYPEETWDILQMGMRLSDSPKIIVTTTPKPMKLLKKIKESPHTVFTQVSTYDNKDFLAPSFFEYFVDDYAKTHLGRQEIFGEIVEDVENALWTPHLLESIRLLESEAPALTDMDRIIVAVDPPVSMGKDADECGIIVIASKTVTNNCGRAIKKAYILEDCTVQGLSPYGWTKAILEACDKYDAHEIIVEDNQGKALIPSVFDLHNREIKPKITRVHASINKLTRASPISALYEQEKIHHIGYHPKLEEQMYQFSTEKIHLPSSKSPDRVDALVWGLHEIFKNEQAIPQVRGLC